MGFWDEERGLSIALTLSTASEARSPLARRLSSLGARQGPIDGVEWCSILSKVLVLPNVQVYFSWVLFCGTELPLILSTLLFTAINLVAQDFTLATVVTCRRQR